ncbi:hypothetical protein BD779DRAFT_1628167 [Infundibulicybe gibba]|nr:hypothetical protein BD779DRAFT_1628167 [Infundibulicybe gibba]
MAQTYASFPYNDYPLLRLANGTLRAFSNGGWDTNATAPSSGGGTLGWVTSTIYTQPAVQIYSAVAAPADRFPRLAVYGNPGLWSLCPFTGPRAQTNVVFNMSGNIPPSATKGFDPAACYTVDIYIVQA